MHFVKLTWGKTAQAKGQAEQWGSETAGVGCANPTGAEEQGWNVELGSKRGKLGSPAWMWAGSWAERRDPIVSFSPENFLQHFP